VLDEEEIRSLLVSLANGRAYLSQALGDVPGTVKYAQRALDLLLESDYFERGLSAILLGFAYWTSGELDAAQSVVIDAIANMRMAGKTLHMISFTSYLADIMVAQGRLHEATRTYLQLLEVVTMPGKPEPQETAVLHLGLSEIYHEQGNLEAARQHFLKSEELGEQPTIPPWYRHWVFAQTQMEMAQRNPERVVEMFSEAEYLYYKHPIPDVRPLAALKTRVWLAQGGLSEALGWARERGLSIDDELSYLGEYEYVTFARVLIARHKHGGADDSIGDATKVLERLLIAAEEGGRLGSVIEILILQAVAYELQGNRQAALRALEGALTLAGPEGYVRVFVDEGQPMEELLLRMQGEGGRMIAYVQRLLAAFGQQEDGHSSSSVRDRQLPISSYPPIETLSEREREVLQLIAEGLTNREIGDRLYLSLNTIKVHTRNIYGKLDVHSRTQAIARAQELGLLSPRSF
jgi:LuxR family maltose regulon positive regulatory protein